MNPQEKALLERTLELSEENNRILHKMQRTARLALVWGFVKVLLIVVPLVVGYVLLEPHFGPIQESWDAMKALLYIGS